MEPGNSWGKLQSSLHVSPRELEEHEQGQQRVRFLPCLSPNAPPSSRMTRSAPGRRTRGHGTAFTWDLLAGASARPWKAHAETKR